jgi:hypothetical protein
VNRALRAWGANPPDWIMRLAAECDSKTQAQVGQELGASGSAVNAVLGRRYPGRLDRLEQKVRGLYMKATVECPVLGEISTKDCLDNQRQAKTFRATNPIRRDLFIECKRCPNREKPKEDADDAPAN